MRTCLIPLCAVLAFANTAHAQQPEVPGWPINSCVEIAGHYNNPYDVVIDLAMSPICNYWLTVRGRTATGVAGLVNGTLTIVHKDEDGTTYRIVLRRSGENLAGKVFFTMILFPMSPPIQFFRVPVKP